MLLELRVALEPELGGKAHYGGPAGTDTISQVRDGAKGQQRGLGESGLRYAPLGRREFAADCSDQIEGRHGWLVPVHIVTLSQINRSMCYINAYWQYRIRGAMCQQQVSTSRQKGNRLSGIRSRIRNTTARSSTA